ncbi:MAG: sulfite exporter TauE/SafE family protein [Actinomycetes bacterium]
MSVVPWEGPALGELAVILAAMAVGGFVKGAAGAGLPQITIPVMAIFLGVEHAVVVMAIPGVVINAWLFWVHRAHLRATRDLPVLLVAGVLGTVLGTLGLTALHSQALTFVLAGVILLYVAVVLSKWEIALPAALSRYTSPPVGLAAGLLQGSTGMSGPVLSTYLHSYRLGKETLVISLVTLFQVFALTQVFTLLQLGLYSTSRVVESLLALVPLMMAVPAGTWVSRRMSRRGFDLLVAAVLTLSAATLLQGAVGG